MCVFYRYYYCCRALNKIKVTNLSRELYTELDAIMNLRFETHAAFIDLVAPGTSASLLSPSQHQEVVATRGEDGSASREASTGRSQRTVFDVMRRVAAGECSDGAVVNAIGDIASFQSTPTTSLTPRDRGQKRRRVHHLAKPSSSVPSAPGFIDAATADYFLEKIQAIHEEDRAERRQQHAEHMAALTELTDLLRHQHSSKDVRA